MAPTLYMVKPSPPVRAVQITAKALDIELDIKEVDFTKQEHLAPEFIKLNPQHTVPTLVDDDFAIWDSHAIMVYFVTKYTKDSALYPINELKKKALIDQRLHFDSGVVFPNIRNIGKTLIHDKKELQKSHFDSITQVYTFLEAFLESTLWAAGDSVTIADYSLFASITTLNVCLPVDSKKFPLIVKWLKNVEKLPEAAENKEGLAAVVALFQKASAPPVAAEVVTESQEKENNE